MNRRHLLLSALGASVVSLPGCRASLPALPGENSDPDALELLHESADAHGLAAFGRIVDLNVSYGGQWKRLVGRIQPALVDRGFRGVSQERLLLRAGIIAQSHTGPAGHKQVVVVDTPREKSIHVWFNGNEASDRERVDAAALVAEAYSLFLLGPMLLVKNEHPRRDIRATLAGTADVERDGQTHLCDILNLRVSPGFGRSESDQLALYIDRQTRVMRMVRMSLNGLESTRGAVVDIATFAHRSMHGVLWPTGFHEKLIRPLPLDVHEWTLTGLDIDRGEVPADVLGVSFDGSASKDAAPLAS